MKKYDLISNLYWVLENRENLNTYMCGTVFLSWSLMVLMNYFGNFYVAKEPWLIINVPLFFVVFNFIKSVLIDWQSSGIMGLYYLVLWIASNCFYNTIEYSWIPASALYFGGWVLVLHPVSNEFMLLLEEIFRTLLNGPQLAILGVLMIKGYRNDLMSGYKRYKQLLTGIMSDSYPIV